MWFVSPDLWQELDGAGGQGMDPPAVLPTSRRSFPPPDFCWVDAECLEVVEQLPGTLCEHCLVWPQGDEFPAGGLQRILGGSLNTSSRCMKITLSTVHQAEKSLGTWLSEQM